MSDILNLSRVSQRSAAQEQAIFQVTELTGIASGGPFTPGGTDTLVVILSPIPKSSRIVFREGNEHFELLGLRLRKRRYSPTLEVDYRFKGDPLETNKAVIKVELYNTAGELNLTLSIEQSDIRTKPLELGLVSANAVLTRMDHNRGKFRLVPKDLKNLASIRLVFERILIESPPGAEGGNDND